MPQEKNSHNQTMLQRPTSASMSNSFHPALPQQRGKSPLPAIKSQTDTMAADDSDLVLPMKVFQAKKTSVKDLSQALCAYLWFRRIKEIFLVMGKQNDAFTRFDMQLARTDMIQTCDQYLENDRPKDKVTDATSQKKLDDWKNKRLYAETFRMSYFRKDADVEEKNIAKFTSLMTQTNLTHGEIPIFDNAIWWYSCNEAPIFNQMNNILRLENFELLMCHRYYISDLCQMIERAYAIDKFSQKRMVYRADKLSKEDFESLNQSKNEKDARITINGFISTSRNEKISLEYAANKLKKRGNDVVIMYEITIDPNIPCTAYADIESISFHPREEEILFNMGSTFQIDDIVPDPTNPDIQRIKLTARDFHASLVDEMKAKVKQASQATLSLLLVRYLIELGEDRVCKRYLNQLIDSKHLDNDLNLVAAYNCLGSIHSRQALYGEALEYYRKALNTQARIQFSNNNAFAEIFNYIGQTHLGLKQFEEAKQNLEEGIRIQLREPKISQQHLASLYCNLGQVAYAKRDWDEAQEHFERAYDLYSRSTKISHDALEKQLQKADLCVAFGHLKSVRNRKDPAEANEMFQEALDIYQCILPPSHPKVAETRLDIISEYIVNKYYSVAIDYYENHVKALLDDYETKPTTSQTDLARLYTNLGACYACEQKFDQAIEIWQKAMGHEQRSYLDELLSSARVAKITSDVRFVEGAYRSALLHYLKNPNAPKEHLAFLYAKTYAYEQVIESLRGQNSILLAQTCIAVRNSRGSFVVYKRIVESTKNIDDTILIGLLVEILKIKLSAVTEEHIKELLNIDSRLQRKSRDNEANRLRMIVNDYLAQSSLELKSFVKAREYCQVSFELKQRHYSSNHPSLIRNYQLMAACCFQQNDLKNAVQYYEKAIEIQLENMPSNHPDIRANYFLLGDCYCRMDKLELANEAYEQGKGSNDPDTEDENAKEIDAKALLRMYSYLSKAYEKQGDFSTASSHQQAKIDKLREILPEWIVAMMEEEDDDLQMSFDQLKKLIKSRLGLSEGHKFGQVLQNLVYARSSQARVLLELSERNDSDDDSTDVFQQAIELRLKLMLFESPNVKDFAQQYEELAQAYRRLYWREQENIRENSIKALEQSASAEQQRALEFRLGNLFYEDENYNEADRYWRSALKKVKDDQVIIKSIIEKLIQKNQVHLSSSSENSDDDDDDDNENTNEEAEKPEEDAQEEPQEDTEQKPSRPPSNQSRRASSVKSVREKERPDDYAQAYIDLFDDETALKYLKKHIGKLEESVKIDLPKVEISSARSSLVQLYYTLIDEALKSKEIPNETTWTGLLQAQMKSFLCSQRLGDEFDTMVNAMKNIFYITTKFNLLPNGLVTLFDHLFKNDLDELQWDDLNKIVSKTATINIFIRVADYQYCQEEYLAALKVYFTLEDHITDDPALRSMIHFGILKLLRVNIAADEDYCASVEKVDIKLDTIPIFDRILLCRLIIAFYMELESEEKANEYERRLIALYREDWPIQSLKETAGIGQQLIRFDHHRLASSYWQDLQNLFVEVIPDSVKSHLYSSDWTFEQLYREAQEISNDLSEHLTALALSYGLMADYDAKCEWEYDARLSLEKAIAIGKKLTLLVKEVGEWQMELTKLKDAEDAD